MGEEKEFGTETLDSFSETIELRFRQKPELDTPLTELSADELTLGSVDERIKQATGPILRRLEDICVLLVGRTEVESAGNSEASGWRRSHESIIPSRNRRDSYRT